MKTEKIDVAMKNIVAVIIVLMMVIPSQAEEISRALHFDGVNDYVQINDTIGEAQTISFWFNQTISPDGTPAGQPVMTFNNTKNCFIAINDSDPNISGETILISINDRKLYTKEEMIAGWNQITITSDGSYYRNIYVNGEPVETLINEQLPPNISIHQLTLGANLRSYKFFNGTLSELSFWGTPFSTSFVKNNFASVYTYNQLNRLAYFRFDNSPADTLIEQNGEIQGQLVNFDYAGEHSDWMGFGAPVGHKQVILNHEGESKNIAGPIMLNATALSNSEAAVYRYDEVPAHLSGISAPLGENNIVFGVFFPKAKGNIQLKLDYTDYSFAHYKEEYLAIYHREHSSDYTWQDINAELDTATNTITIKNYQRKTGEFMLVSNAVPLPVTFSHVSAKGIDNSVHIQWTTQCEINNDYFTIQRRAGNGNWIDLGSVSGAGNSRLSESYEFIDYNPVYGQNLIQYRIQQTDYDGQFSYSNVVVYRNTNSIEIETYPNPATEHLFLRLHDHQDVNIQVFHSSGQRMDVEDRHINDGEIQLNVSDWESGIYIVRAQYAGGTYQKSVLVR